MAVFSFIFTQLSLIARQKNLSNRRQKQILASNSTSRSLKVKHFRVTGKPIKHFMMLHNNTGLTLTVLKIWRLKVPKIAGSDYPTVVWAPHHKTPMSLIPTESRVAGLNFRCGRCGSIFFQILVVNSERRIICAVECNTAVQGHPSSLILVSIERAYGTSYYWLIVTLALSGTVSEIRLLIG